MTAAAVLLLLARTASAADFQALGVSPGRGGRVTARVTFDRAKALGGGLIFILPQATAEDVEAIRMSEAVIATSGGLSSLAALTAREHGVSAIILSEARWEKGPALTVEESVFGPLKRGAGGLSYQVVEKTVPWHIKEGEAATVDAGKGLLRLYSPAEQDGEAALASALRAYDGLRDAQALSQWFEGRAAATSDPAALGARILEELAERTVDGAARPEDFVKVRKAVLAALPAEGRRRLSVEGRRTVDARAREQSQKFKDALAALKEAGTERAAKNIGDEARARWERLRSLAEAVGGKADLKKASDAYAAVKSLAEARLKALRGKPSENLSDIVAAAGAAAFETVTLSSAAYKRFLAESGLEPLIDEIGQDASLDLRRKSERIRSLILAAKVPSDLPAGRPSGELFLVTGEGGASSYAAPDDLPAAVKEAWVSYWSPEALGARKRSGGSLQPAAEVSIQKVQAADASGLAYTRDPADGSRERIAVDAVLGEEGGLRTGDVFADQYVLDRETGREVLPALVADKREKAVFDAKKKSLSRVVVPPGLSLGRALSERQLEKLARAARALDNHYGGGLEVEFAFIGEKLFILKTRPLAPPASPAAPAAPPR